MKVLTEGHKYIAANFDNGFDGQEIQFIEKRPLNDGSGTLELVNDGTTNEGLLAVLIDRLNYLQGKFPCRENAIVITKLEEARHWLEHRTNDRKARSVEGKPLK